MRIRMANRMRMETWSRMRRRNRIGKRNIGLSKIGSMIGIKRRTGRRIRVVKNSNGLREVQQVSKVEREIGVGGRCESYFGKDEKVGNNKYTSRCLRSTSRRNNKVEE